MTILFIGKVPATLALSLLQLEITSPSEHNETEKREIVINTLLVL